MALRNRKSRIIVLLIGMFLATGLITKYRGITVKSLLTNDTDASSGTSQFPIQQNVTQAPRPRQRLKLLIHAYMRTGSTFVGNMFEYNPDVFFVYEPLNGLYFPYTQNRTNQTSSFLLRLLRCELETLEKSFFKLAILALSSDTNGFYSCTKNQSLESCLPALKQSCLNSTSVVTKTVRISTLVAENMLRHDPDLKIIHMVRDPRAIFRSQAEKSIFSTQSLRSHSLVFCRRILDDVIMTRRLLALFPGRVKLVHFEDVAPDPIGSMEELYKFAGLDVSKSTEEKIKALTFGKTDSRCWTCTQRENSSFEAVRWRTLIGFSDVGIIDNNCRDLYQELGYIPVNSEQDLRNLRLSLRKHG